ncbi:transposase [Clostridium sp. WILCCON 0269]|uniref:Transposase n=1 Tax=Candidatus Clostridium eludens TaxID=3381663 RepID=A0ABW8SXZ3_9CLOT
MAKYAGIVWKENQSGGFKAENTPMNKAGNRYLRYYLILLDILPNCFIVKISLTYRLDYFCAIKP